MQVGPETALHEKSVLDIYTYECTHTIRIILRTKVSYLHGVDKKLATDDRCSMKIENLIHDVVHKIWKLLLD